MAARRLMPGGRGVAERRRDELSASPLRRGASTQTSWTSSAQVHKRLRGGRYRTGNAIYELQFLGDLWSVEIKASVVSLTLRYNTPFRRSCLAIRNTRAFPIMAHCQSISETGGCCRLW